MVISCSTVTLYSLELEPACVLSLITNFTFNAPFSIKLSCHSKIKVESYMSYYTTLYLWLPLSIHFIKIDFWLEGLARVMVMVFNATFRNILQLYRGGQFYWWGNRNIRENHLPAASKWQTLSHIKLYRVHLAVTSGIRTHNFSGDIGMVIA